MKKEGQLLSEPFVLIFALIVGALILVWGMNYVFKLKDVGESIEINSYVSKLREDVESFYYLDEGTSKSIAMRLPPKIDVVCFKGNTTLNNNEIFNKYPGIMPIMENEYRNVFFLPIQSYKTTIYNIEKLKPAGLNPLCFKNGQKAKITTRETYVEIS